MEHTSPGFPTFTLEEEDLNNKISYRNYIINSKYKINNLPLVGENSNGILS
jgi:hypothetical protein